MRRATVRTERDIEVNVRTFWGLPASSPTPSPAAREMLRRARNLVALEFEDVGLLFAPSRFTGYLDNDFEAHAADGVKNGGVTDPAISRVLGVAPSPNRKLETKFGLLCDRLQIDPYDQQRDYWPRVRVGNWNSSSELEGLIADAATDAVEGQAARARGQGFVSTPERRRAIELHAMAAATLHFKAKGYSVSNTSASKPYDLVARKDGDLLYVEVKGTTTLGESVILTRGEVEHARSHAGQMVLFVLGGIEVHGDEEETVASGGSPTILWPWDVDAGELAVLSYSHRLPPTKNGRTMGKLRP